MKFSCHVHTRISDAAIARDLEDWGYDAVWFTDTQMMWSDCFATMALAAQCTSKIRIGTGVTVAGTRIAPTTAAAIASINVLAPGRTFLGIGTGHTAMRVMGQDPMPIKEFREYLRVVRGLLHGEAVPYTYHGSTTEIAWQTHGGGFRNTWDAIPIYVAANGPLALKAAGAYGDGLISMFSERPEERLNQIEAVRAGARQAGRELAENFHSVLICHPVTLRAGENLGSLRVRETAGPWVLAALHFLYEAHRYSGLFQRETRWRLAAETWLMVGFITWLLWQTGNADSPLLNLYLLALIMSGLTLGKTTTLLQLLLIVAIYVQTDYRALGEISFSTASVNELMTKFAPFVLITYLVTLLAADIKFSRTALQAASETDELTGLPNRRAFHETLTREFERASQQTRMFSVLVIDADGLKPTNDAYGHAAGDRLIRQIADSIKTTLRGSDHCARYGGDEFVALLADTDASRAMEAAERLRLCVANTSFDASGNRVNSTISIGVATYPTDAADAERLLAVADRALYQAKNEGKNRSRGIGERAVSIDVPRSSKAA